MSDESKTVPELLRSAAATYEERNKTYGSNYKKYGAVVDAIFPDGILLKTADDHNRFGVLTMILSKLTRYAQNFEKGGHADSIHDLQVYAAMLEELDAEPLIKPPAVNVSVGGHLTLAEVREVIAVINEKLKIGDE